MRRALAVFILCFLATPAAHATRKATLTVGLNLGYPEWAGIALSYWATQELTIDAMATIASIDGGVTGHFPVAHSGAWRHALLVSGLVGWAGLPYEPGYNGVRLGLLGGYGLLHRIDLRILLGVTAATANNGRWGPGLVTEVIVGYPFSF